MRHGSLFSGIGGFDLAAEWMGWDNVFYCEIGEFQRKVLKHHFPNSISYEDITKTDFTIHKGQIDILTGGFPCQPFSQAGKRKGTADDRHLWPQMLRAIQELQPSWIVGENVYGIVNWSEGLVFEQVQVDLENEGYEVQPVILPAAGIGAPHRRDRVWFIAYSNRVNDTYVRETNRKKNRIQKEDRQEICTGKSIRANAIQKNATNTNSYGQHGCNSEDEKHTSERGQYAQRNIDKGLVNGVIADTENTRLKARLEGQGQEELRGRNEPIWSGQWDGFPTQSPVCGKYDGLSIWMVRHIKKEVYATISEKYTDKDLQEVSKAFQSSEVREKIGRLYKIHEPYLLLKTVQLCSPSNKDEKGISLFSEETSKGLLRKLQLYGTFTNTPQGRELGKQFDREFANTLPKLSHEIALVHMEVEEVCMKARSKWRQESLKGLGNAIVPEVAYQIFKTIEQYEQL